MTDAERGEFFRSYVDRPANHNGESYVSKLLDRVQAAEAEAERLRTAIQKTYGSTNGWVLATLEGALLYPANGEK